MPSLARVTRSKLCITPLGVPVEPDVYINKARSAPPRAGLPAMGWAFATMLSQVS